MAKEIILPFSELKATLNDTPIEPTLEITENGVYDVKGYSYVDVNVAGGGSSDLSTVDMIIDNSSEYTGVIGTMARACEENELGEGSPAMAYYDIETVANQTTTNKVILYKGKAWITMSINGFSTTGDITDMGDYTYMVTGDCAIIISTDD